MNTKGVNIFKIVSPTGKRLGAILRESGKPDVYLTLYDLRGLGNYFARTNQGFDNATITVDGRIRSKKSRSVKEETFDENVFKMRKKSQVKPQSTQKPQSEQKPQSTPQTQPKTVIAVDTTKDLYTREGKADKIKLDKDNFEKADLAFSNTVDRVRLLIEEGIYLARCAGVSVKIAGISCSTWIYSKRKACLFVTAKSEQFAPLYTSSVELEVSPDSGIILYARRADKAGSANDLWNTAPEPTAIKCRTPRDLCTMLRWLAMKNGKHKRTHELEAEAARILLDGDSHYKNKFTQRKVTYVYPHTPIQENLKKHIDSLEQLRIELNEYFEGQYIFEWDIEDLSAILSVRLYTQIEDAELRRMLDTDASEEKGLIQGSRDAERVKKILTDTLVLLRLDLKDGFKDKYLTLSHKVLFGGKSWVTLDEHRHLDYVDAVCLGVKFLLDEVLQTGFIRSGMTVMAWGMLGGVPHYLISGQEAAVSETELLNLRNGRLVDGISFKKDVSGTICVFNNLDRYGNPLPQFADLHGERLVRIMYAFKDSNTGAFDEIKLPYSWNAYNRIKKCTRSSRVTLKQPSKYFKELLFLPDTQLNALSYLGGKLAAKLNEKQYVGEDALKYVLDFMSCFRFSALVNVTDNFKTPFEMLLERRGCCLELSLLAATLGSLVGFDSSVILRYSTTLTTNYHVVAGMRLSKTDRGCSTQGSVANMGAKRLEVLGYQGLELTYNMYGAIGEVCDWGTDRGCHATTDPVPDRHASQVVVLPISDFKVCHPQALAHIEGKYTVVPFKAPHWFKILSWFK